MGTRAVIYVLERDLTPVLSLYSQYDGYLRKPGIGWRLEQFLDGRLVVDGIRHTDTWRTVSNGMADLAAQLVWTLKKDALLGAIYLHAMPLKPKRGQSFDEYLPTLVRSPSSDTAEYLYVIHLEDAYRPMLWSMEMTRDAIRRICQTWVTAPIKV